MAKFRPTRIDPPGWASQPELRADGITAGEFAAIQAHRPKLLRAVHREVTAYLNDPRLVFDGDEDGFPHLLRLTGEYYLGDESYTAHRDPDWFQIGVMCRFLEHGDDRPDDYLGLEVWLKCVPRRWATFEAFRNTDSSVI
ncbi:MAG: hypothetical protein K2V38_17485 [Gemmataceae bacterium]|nr:hypothetical protein [Gemmataceae bacterium]